jgi:hypothetical protein
MRIRAATVRRPVPVNGLGEQTQWRKVPPTVEVDGRETMGIPRRVPGIVNLATAGVGHPSVDRDLPRRLGSGTHCVAKSTDGCSNGESMDILRRWQGGRGTKAPQQPVNKRLALSLGINQSSSESAARNDTGIAGTSNRVALRQLNGCGSTAVTYENLKGLQHRGNYRAHKAILTPQTRRRCCTPGATAPGGRAGVRQVVALAGDTDSSLPNGKTDRSSWSGI